MHAGPYVVVAGFAKYTENFYIEEDGNRVASDIDTGKRRKSV